jgi:tetratricopeptide (TPR) repeat protein
MRSVDLMRSRKYADAVAACKQELSVNPNDFTAMDRMASALLALEKYEEALPVFERLDAYWKGLEIAPGSPGRQMDISCLYWFLGNRQRAIALARGLVDGILNGSIQYGDAAGGMQQGLLLYYMAVTECQPAQAACALDYMRNRLDRRRRLLPPGVTIESWPVPVARYYLGDLAFDELLVFATGQGELPEAIAAAGAKLMSRRKLCVALFHDGVKSRAQGAEEQCLARMRECYGLEDPLIEPEWYLARHEVEQAAAKA